MENHIIATTEGRLAGYCGKCGLMLLSRERKCTRCGTSAASRTQTKPEPAGAIVAIGYSRFTQYTVGNEKL